MIEPGGNGDHIYNSIDLNNFEDTLNKILNKFLTKFSEEFNQQYFKVI